MRRWTICAATIATVLLWVGNLRGMDVAAHDLEDLGSPSARNPRELAVGEPIRRFLGGGERHAYSLSVGPNEYVALAVRQDGVDVVVSLWSADRQLLGEVDTPTGTQGQEKACWITGSETSLGIEVAAMDREAEGGFYEIVLEQRRAAVPRDRSRVDAQQAFARAYGLQAKADVASQAEALRLFEKALDVWEPDGDSYRAGIALHSIGQTHAALNDNEGAIGCFQAALQARRAAADLSGEAYTLTELSSIKVAIGAISSALADLREALTIERELGDLRMEAEVLINLGKVHDSVGDKDAAIREYSQALPVIRATRNRSAEVRTLNRMATAYESAGEKQKALDFYRQALELNRSLGNQVYEAVISGNVGRVYSALGESEKAIRFLRDSLAATRRLGDRHSEAVTLVDLGRVEADRGDLEGARAAYNQALPLLVAVEDRRMEAAALNQLGQTYANEKRWDQAARTFDRALAAARATSDPYREADSLTHLGAARAGGGNLEEGLRCLEQALDLRRKVGDHLGEAWSSFELARIERQRGEIARARVLLEACLRDVESLRGSLVSTATRARFFVSARSYYEEYIDLLMSGTPADARLALETSERARARSLLDTLSESRARIREGSEPALLERASLLRKELNDNLQRRIQLSGPTQTQREAERSEREIENLLNDLEQVEERIRAQSPRYAALTRPQTVQLESIQSLLDPDTMLLEYWLGARRSFVWSVTRESFSVYELAPSAEIEARVRRLHESLTRPPRPGGDGSNRLRESLRGLSRLLLGPLTGGVAGRLVVVGDGALEYLPFGVLNEKTRADHPEIIPLARRHEIVQIPSASVVSMQRQQWERREAPRRTMIVVADPVFDSSDGRVVKPSFVLARPVGSPRKKKTAGPASGLRGAGSFEQTQPFGRLPFTRREGNAILSLVDSGDRKAAFDFDASLATVRSEELIQYRFVHLATHGSLNTARPELSGLVFSLVDRGGRDQDGFLPAMEVFNLKLAAEVVVLSACQTALGKEIRGEGLVGLTRAFMYAGSPRVVASLWRVDDAATAELMKRFYEGMLGPTKLRPAAALRKAQLAVSRQKRWEHPYYWAGFVLQGEWR